MLRALNLSNKGLEIKKNCTKFIFYFQAPVPFIDCIKSRHGVGHLKEPKLSFQDSFNSDSGITGHAVYVQQVIVIHTTQAYKNVYSHTKHCMCIINMCQYWMENCISLDVFLGVCTESGWTKQGRTIVDEGWTCWCCAEWSWIVAHVLEGVWVNGEWTADGWAKLDRTILDESWTNGSCSEWFWILVHVHVLERVWVKRDWAEDGWATQGRTTCILDEG